MADIKNAKTPAVQGNALKNLTVDDLIRENLGVLAVRNPDSYNQKLLGYIDPTYLQLRLPVNDKLKDILNTAHPNNYTVKIPTDIGPYPEYLKKGLTSNGLTDILKILPNLKLINAEYLINTDDIGIKCWTVSWDFDGVFGTQIAEIKGLVFSRNATYNNGKTIWTNWGFHNDTQMIGTTRMDFSRVSGGENYMGWIKIPSDYKLKRSEYPKLFDFLVKSGAYEKNKGIINVTSTELQISNPAGFFPRIVGSQTVNGFNSNPDYPNAKVSDNYDYANNYSVSFNISGHSGPYGEEGVSSEGCMSHSSEQWGRAAKLGSSYGGVSRIRFNYSYNKGVINSYNETRPKSKFYNLLIYAGYPA